MTEAGWYVCEQLAQSGYMTLEWPGVRPTASWWQQLQHLVH